MGRYWKDSDDRQEPAAPSGVSGDSRTPPRRPDGPDARFPAERVSSRTAREQPKTGARTVYELRDRSYRLNTRQVGALRAVGAFRTIRAQDLLETVYQGDRKAFEVDSRALTQQSLLSSDRVLGRPRDEYLSLTEAGKDLTQVKLRSDPRQEVYAGLVKAKELEHDAALYRMYAKKVQEIAQNGGTPTRVVLDYEFKAKLSKAINEAAQLPAREREEELARIARAHELAVVDNKIPLPDLRIEYETHDGERAHCDLEFVTDNYRAGAILEKARAGFTLYTADGNVSRKIRDEYPSLAAQVLSL